MSPLHFLRELLVRLTSLFDLQCSCAMLAMQSVILCLSCMHWENNPLQSHGSQQGSLTRQPHCSLQIFGLTTAESTTENSWLDSLCLAAGSFRKQLSRCFYEPVAELADEFEQKASAEHKDRAKKDFTWYAFANHPIRMNEPCLAMLGLLAFHGN